MYLNILEVKANSGFYRVLLTVGYECSHWQSGVPCTPGLAVLKGTRVWVFGMVKQSLYSSVNLPNFCIRFLFWPRKDKLMELLFLLVWIPFNDIMFVCHQ